MCMPVEPSAVNDDSSISDRYRKWGSHKPAMGVLPMNFVTLGSMSPTSLLHSARSQQQNLVNIVHSCRDLPAGCMCTSPYRESIYVGVVEALAGKEQVANFRETVSRSSPSTRENLSFCAGQAEGQSLLGATMLTPNIP